MDPAPAPVPPPGGVAPIFCSLIPREILAIAGLEPAEILPPAEPDLTGRHACALCENICSWVRHLLGRLDDPQFAFLVVPASCDAMTKLHDALRHGGAGNRLFRLEVPRRSDAAGVRYLASQYAALLAALGAREADLEAAKRRLPTSAPRGDAVPSPALPATRRPRVGLAGSVFPEALFRESLQAAGAEVHALRRCGMALPGGPPHGLWEATGIETFCTRLAEHYLASAVCPRMMGTAFAECLAREVAARQLHGIVVPILKFCDGYHLAVERLAARLPGGFPLLIVEGDLTTGFGEQTVTRLEAFVERLADVGGSGSGARSPAAARLVVGVDVGSTQVKAVLMGADRHLACTYIRPTTGRMMDASTDAVDRLLGKAGVARGDVAAVGVTGYGRKAVAADAVATEISCHARGVGRFLPEPATIIDVGGQDSKVIVTDGRGRVLRFTMNDKCAAGTGRFLDAMVRTLDLDFDRFSALSLEARSEVPVTSMCSVFAESEVISLGARGEPLPGIARGINASIARRVAGMVRRVQGDAPFVLTGGVSQIPAFVRELERELGANVRVFEHALHAGAIGAAILALETHA